VSITQRTSVENLRVRQDGDNKNPVTALEQPVSKKHHATQDRKARVEEMRREQAAQDRKRRLIVAAVTVPVLILIIVGTYLVIKNASDQTKIDGLKSYSNLSRNHVTTPVTYPQNPPVGGNHNPVWLNCGVYTSPVKNENAVHSLEHGAVWITYLPTLPAKQVAELDAAAKNQLYMIVSPYPGLPAPVVASAWGKQVRLTGADDPRLQKFIKAYEEGPQTPEPGAACTNGTGTPIQQ
jgi:Protein of unknown function (DUF3105)